MFNVLSIPVLGIVIAAILAMSAGGGFFLDGDIYAMTLPLETEMILKGSDVFLLVGIVALFIDMIKIENAQLPGRILSCVTFVVAFGCLLFYAPAASPAFLLLTVMTFGPALVAALKL
jgi:hypothetical protein